MGFKDLFTKKNSTSDCCGVEIVADDDTDTDTTETTSCLLYTSPSPRDA